MTEKEALLPTKRIFCNQCSSKSAQMRRTTRPFAKWNLILAHLQHSKTLEKHEHKD